MSAAEKLRELDAVWKTEGTEEAWQVYKTLMPALSQIVAVVEAAEAQYDADGWLGYEPKDLLVALAAPMMARLDALCGDER